MGATSSREVEESRQTLLQRKAMSVLEARTDRVALVLERVRDPAAELAALQCADYIGLQTVLRVDHAEKYRQMPARSDVHMDAVLRALPELLDVHSYASSAECLSALRSVGATVWAVINPQLSSDIGLPAPTPLNSPKLPAVPARLALVLGDDCEGASPFLAAAADLTVCLPPSFGFVDELPLPAAVALALQGLLARCPEAIGDLPKHRKQNLLTRWRYSPGSKVLGGFKPLSSRNSGEQDERYLISNDPHHAAPSQHSHSHDTNTSILDWNSSLSSSKMQLPSADAKTRAPARDDHPHSVFDLSWMLGLGSSHHSSKHSANPSAGGAVHMKGGMSSSSTRASSGAYPTCSSVQGPFDYDTDPAAFPDGFCARTPPSCFQVRSSTYLTNRQKETAGPPMSELLGCDIFRLDQKVPHICSYLDLPGVPKDLPPPPPGLPALLVVNLMAPLYEPQFFTTVRDGDGLSCVWYWAIDYRRVRPQAMAGLHRFLTQGKEKDGTKSTDQLKLILQLANVEEAFDKGGVLLSEKHMLQTWNGKPVMARPQHHFFRAKNYLEIALDLHSWKYVTRRILMNAPKRFHVLVWDFALLVQANEKEELPEQILASTRMTHTRISQAQHLKIPKT